MMIDTVSNPINRNFWSRGMESASEPAVDRELQCDFLIVGGGLAGLSTALQIKKLVPIARVALIEGGRIGDGSSGSNSGQCGARIGPAIEKQVRSLGEETAAAIYRYSLGAIEYAASLVQELGIECDLRPGRQWQVALTQKDARTLARRAYLYRSLGFDVPLIEQREVREIFPESDHIQNAIEFPAYTLDPYRLCAGLKRAVLEAGIDLHENSPIVSGPDGFRANGYSLHYRRAVLAVDGGAARLSAHTASVLPIAVFAGVTRPLNREEKQRFRGLHDRGLFDARPVFNFLRLIDGERILIGGEYRYASGPIDPRQQELHGERLRQQLALFFPSSRAIELEYRWCGIAGCTLDDWPAIGPLPANPACWYVGAWNGHGIAASLISGYEVVRAIVDDKPTPRLPWFRSSALGLGHPIIARATLPAYLAWLRARSQL
jgi:gamma-glutamylputrescine oxidase